MDDADRAIMQTEAKWWPRAGAKSAAIAELGLTDTRYYQRLLQLCRTPEAVAEFPLVVARVQRRLQFRRVA